MNKLYISLLLISSALVIGCAFQLVVRAGIVHLPFTIEHLRKLLQKIGLLFFMPVSFLSAVWVVSLTDLRVALLPVIGVMALLLGGLFGFALSLLLRCRPKQQGVLICCGSFTNIGSIGALICFMFLGEAGFALVALYKMFEEIVYYTVGFPLARYYSGVSDNQNVPVISRIGSTLRDPFVATILSAFFLGLILNLGNIPRPQFFEQVTAIFIPAGTFILIVSIGLGMRLSQISKHFVPGIAITLIKAIAVPATIVCVAWLLGLGEIENGLVLQVVIILSSMPVAFNSLVAASLYDLDLDLANSCWLISTCSLVVILPWLHWLL